MWRMFRGYFDWCSLEEFESRRTRRVYVRYYQEGSVKITLEKLKLRVKREKRKLAVLRGSIDWGM